VRRNIPIIKRPTTIHTVPITLTILAGHIMKGFDKYGLKAKTKVCKVFPAKLRRAPAATLFHLKFGKFAFIQRYATMGKIR